MKIHISEILPACDSELTLTNIGSHNVEHVISLIRQLVKITDVDRIENSTKNLLSQENIRVKEVNKYGKILDNKQDNEDKENNEDNEDTYHYQWQEGDWHYINTAQGKRYLRVRNLPALLEDTQFLKYANLIEQGGTISRPYIGISMVDLTEEYYLWQNRIVIPEDVEKGINSRKCIISKYWNSNLHSNTG